MKVWTMKDGELLPIQARARPMRTWMLSAALAARGHDVTWWASTFSHQRKELLYAADCLVAVQPGLQLRLLSAGAYHRHVSVQRFAHHLRLAHRFRRAAADEPPPDAIVCAYPLIDWSYEVVRYAQRRAVPVVIDARDYWPDSFIPLAPAPLRPLVRAALAQQQRRAAYVMQHATSVVASSEGLLTWALRKASRPAGALDMVIPIGAPAGSGPLPATGAIAALRERLRGATICVFLGSLGHAWDPFVVCDAAESAQRDDGAPPLHFVIAGDGPRRAAVEARAGKLPNVTVLGWLDATGIRQLLGIADIGLAPYSLAPEAVPNKVYEYLAAGLPVVGSMHGEAARLLEKHSVGLTFAAGDASALLTQIRLLSNMPDLRKDMAASAIRLFEREFRADVVYDAYARHVERVAGPGDFLNSSQRDPAAELQQGTKS
jgi:glycosyltransferase involved in cell wall biosynthesis